MLGTFESSLRPAEGPVRKGTVRYHGRIRFDDVREADLDVAVEVSDSHVRFVSGDESLGSWCLADVVADRVVANEFEIDLNGEVITFLADDQVNFAYGAVQQMAEGWARYHAMNLVRRHRAVAAARRYNERSRFDEARQAFSVAEPALRETARYEPEPEPDPVPEPAAEEVPPAPAPAAPREGGFWERVERASGGPGDGEGAEPTPSEPTAPAPARRPSPPPELPAEGPEVEQPAARAPDGPGRLRRLDTFPRAPSAPRPQEDDSPPPAPAPPRGRRVRPPEPEPVPTARQEIPDEDEPQPEREVPAGAQPSISPDVAEERAEPEEAPPVEEVSEEPAHEAMPQEVLEELEIEETDGSQENGQGRRRRRLEPVGAYGDGHHPAETSGLRASMRSLFSRSKGTHEHHFVESTTAVGLTRRVCIECGHVSIGVSE